MAGGPGDGQASHDFKYNDRLERGHSPRRSATGGHAMKISARNALKGRVKSIHVGAVNSEVVIDVGGTEIVSIITKTSAEALGLEEGSEVYAVIKASDVMVAVEH
jgi:molybdopterin-binding protein